MKTRESATKIEIIETAIPLFAESGYNGVTMRQIGQKVGMRAASLYYHFPDKQTLYITAVKHAFSKNEIDLFKVLQMKVSPRKKLRLFLEKNAQLLKNDASLRALMEREMLDGDEDRLKILAEQVFRNFFTGITELTKELSPDRDPHLLAISIFGLIAHHYQITPIRVFLEGNRPEHDDPAVVVNHVMSLLTEGIGLS